METNKLSFMIIALASIVGISIFFMLPYAHSDDILLINNGGSNVNNTQIIAGTGISVTDFGNGTFIVTNTAPDNTNCVNLGTIGEGIYVSGECNFKKVVAGTGISFGVNGTRIIFTNSLPEQGCSSAGGTSIWKTTSTCDAKGLAVTSPIELTSNTNDLTLACSTCVTTSTSYVELCRDQASNGDTSMSCNFTAHKYLMVDVQIFTQTSSATNAVRFNSDSGSNYSWRLSTNNGADASSVSDQSGRFTGAISNVSTRSSIFQINCVDVASFDKVCFTMGGITPSSATVTPDYTTGSFYWDNSSNAGTTFEVLRVAGTGTYTTDSLIVVYGHD